MKKEETMINRNRTASATTTFFKVLSVCFLYCAYRSSSSLVDKINSSNKIRLIYHHRVAVQFFSASRALYISLANFNIPESNGFDHPHSASHPTSPPRISIMRTKNYFFFSSNFRSAKGLWVAGATSPAPRPRTASSSSRECSLSWQYTQSNSQLLPSAGLLSWLWSL